MLKYLYDYGPIISLLTFFAGFILGHRLNLWRDKRKEFNDAALPIFEKLNRQERVLRDDRQLGIAPSNDELDIFERHLPWWKKTCFRKALRNYDETFDKNTEYKNGHLEIINFDHLIASVKKLKSYTKRK